MDNINDSLEVPKRQLQPDRYYTPQVHQQLKEKVHAEPYQPTPRPESVIINQDAHVPRPENCCLSCLLACLLCLAVKGENVPAAPPPPITTLSTTAKSSTCC